MEGSEISGGALPDLMDLLAHEEATWSEVEVLLTDFPGWLRILDTLRAPTLNFATRTVLVGSPLQYDLVGAERRKRLADIFRPFAILLDARLSPPERAARLRSEAGVDPTRFCREHLQDGIPQIREAAQLVLEASRAEGGLLRQASSPAANDQELLRTSMGNAPQDANLLTPSDAATGASSPPPSLWQRLFRRNS